MDGSSVLKEFQERVNNVVTESLSVYDPQKHANEKSIRDAVWGTSRFYAWEVAVLDSPLIQRLRDIHQTGLAFQVYPTAVHTRFDHTLGVVRIASRIVRSINDKHPQMKDPIIFYADHMRIRLSALLHDVDTRAFPMSRRRFLELQKNSRLCTYISTNYTGLHLNPMR